MGIVVLPKKPKKPKYDAPKPKKKKAKPVTPKVKKGIYRGKPIGKKPDRLYT